MTVKEIFNRSNRGPRPIINRPTFIELFNRVRRDITNEVDFNFMRFTDSLTIVKSGTVTVLDFNDLSGKTLTIKFTNTGTQVQTTTVLTEGIDWTAATDNDTTAGTINTAFNAIVGIKSTVSSNVVTVVRDGVTFRIDSLATSALEADMTAVLTTQTVYNLTDINDGDTTNGLVKKIYEIRNVFETNRVDSDDALTIEFNRIIGPRIPDWRLQGNQLLFDTAPTDSQLFLDTLHRPTPLVEADFALGATFTILIPEEYHDLIVVGIKKENDIDTMETSPLQQSYNIRLGQFIADYKSRFDEDHRSPNITLSAKLSDGTELPNF